MQINGREARVISFATQQHNLSLALVVLNKGSVTYALAFAGPGNEPDAWQRLENALPTALTIQ